jgi:hypothetical protein
MKLHTRLYLTAADMLLDHEHQYCCFAIDQASNIRLERMGLTECIYGEQAPETVFFQGLFGLREEDSFATLYEDVFAPLASPCMEELFELRLMALALAHTLALEHNKGKFHL